MKFTMADEDAALENIKVIATQKVKDAIWDSLIPNDHESARLYMMQKAEEMGLKPVRN